MSRLLSWSTGPFPGVAPMVGGARRARQANFRRRRRTGAELGRRLVSSHGTLNPGDARPRVTRVRLTVLGECGAWPEAGGACSGYLVEHDGFRLVVDLGYATMPRLLELCSADEVDAVFVSHGHPDHCADLNPLLRARAMGGGPRVPLPVYALPGALAAVLALDRPGMLAGVCALHEFAAGDELRIGPFTAQTRLLPHWVPNAGVRISAGGLALAYTGDSGPSPDVVELARDADLLLAEATYLDPVPDDARPYLTSARQAGRQARQAGAGRLLLTHLWPGSDRAAVTAEARAEYPGRTGTAAGGMAVDLS
jgi:ribonuclease BN (tRNA processing enzyme)